jgi:hypothetical protein
MKLRLLFASILFFSHVGFSQGSIELTAEERAYLFHIVKKSPILDNSIGRYFEYNGPVVRFMNKEINYDSVETIIINSPEKLFIRTSEIAKSPKGIIAEAANKMALWELNKVLLAARQSDKDLEKYQQQYAFFEQLLLSKLPANAIKGTNNDMKPHKKLLAVLNPSLNFEDKAAMLSSLNFLSEQDQLDVIKALNATINSYIEKRTLEIYRALGGEATTFENVLIAAGDGSETSGLLNEREKDENGRWNKGLPKAVGLFPYEVKLKVPEKRNKTAIEPLLMPTLDFFTVGNNRLTQLHFDVWGYNSAKQTTVVVERNGITYHLFGSGETRFLSPDSTFSSGKTFQAVINELKNDKIAKIYDKIYGKKGYDFQIETAQKKKDETELKIQKNEKNYSDMTQQTITTSPKSTRKVKKARKAASKKPGSNYSAQPITYSDKKNRRKEQNDIVSLYGQYDYYKRVIEDLEKEKQIAIDLMAIYQRRLDSYTMAMGAHWASYTEKDGLYTFSDSTTFDMYTQEFTFRADTLKTPFEVRLIAIPNGPLSDEADEVMLHVNLVDSKPGFDARLQLNLTDVFESNKWDLSDNLLGVNDSVAIRQLFEGLLTKKTTIKAIARGQGVGEWDGNQTIRSSNRSELASYPVDPMDSTMMRLRTTAVNIFLNRGILIEINTFTDPVATNLKPSNEAINAAMVKYKLTGNDYLSALRTATVLQKIKTELNVLAGEYLTREEAKIVIDRLNKLLDTTKVSCGATSFKWQDLLGN